VDETRRSRSWRRFAALLVLTAVIGAIWAGAAMAAASGPNAPGKRNVATAVKKKAKAAKTTRAQAGTTVRAGDRDCPFAAGAGSSAL
jgi:hypothetical protein